MERVFKLGESDACCISLAVSSYLCGVDMPFNERMSMKIMQAALSFAVAAIVVVALVLYL